jgi:HEAT repeat protein
MRRSTHVRCAIALTIFVGIVAPGAVRADNASRIAELGQLLNTSSSAKARISAVAALARLGDKRAWKPLVGALKDPSASVRALAATALGKLGHKGSLPALAEATLDTDDTVRERAEEALAKVRKANNITVAEAPTEDAKAGTGEAGFGTNAHAVEARPDLYIVINGANDDSPGSTDKASRKKHAEYLKNTVAVALSSEATVTNVAADASKYGLEQRTLDLSVVKLEHRVSGNMVQVEAELRFAVGDKDGRMLSFVSGGATVEVAKKTFSSRNLPMLRQQALEGAVKGLWVKLLAHLRRDASS